MSSDKTEIINAVASVATAFFTALLALIAYIQIKALREENNKWESVKACNIYNTDPILFECTNAIRSLSKGSDYSLSTIRPVLQQVRTLLNYFDSIAVGVNQGIYIRQIVKDNIGDEMCRVASLFTTPEYAAEINFQGLGSLIKLTRELSQDAVTTFRIK